MPTMSLVQKDEKGSDNIVNGATSTKNEPEDSVEEDPTEEKGGVGDVKEEQQHQLISASFVEGGTTLLHITKAAGGSTISSKLVTYLSKASGWLKCKEVSTGKSINVRPRDCKIVHESVQETEKLYKIRLPSWKRPR